MIKIVLSFFGFIELALGVSFYHQNKMLLSILSAITGLALLCISYAIRR